jgi:hypothetical protein
VDISPAPAKPTANAPLSAGIDFGSRQRSIPLHPLKGVPYMKPYKLIQRVVCVCTVVFLATAVAGATDFEDDWDRLHQTLADALTLLEKQQRLPDSSWNPLKEDKKSVEKEIAKLTDEAISMLNVSEASDIKTEITQCQRNIEALRERIGELKTKKLMAPDDVSWKIWKADQSDYADKIDRLESTIAENEARIQRLKTELETALDKIGVDLTEEQMDTLIFSVTGDDDVRLVSVFENVKVITGKLKQLMTDADEEIEAARRYYGMHTVLLKILLALQDAYIEKVDTEYITGLNEIIESNHTLIDRTKKLIKTSEADHRPLYEANLSAQELTAETARSYKRYLQSNKKRVYLLREKVRKEFEIAENTYHTVSNAYALVNLMRSSERFFRALEKLRAPELITFENKEMKEEFRKLSERLADTAS